MEDKYLLDTNVLIYYSNGMLNEKPVIEEMFKESFNISIVSKIEYLGWAGYRGNDRQNKSAREFIDIGNVLDLDNKIAEETISIRQKYSIKIPDAIITATAKIYRLILVTANVYDFTGVGVEIINPFDM